MGLFRRATPTDSAAVEQMKAELATLRAALDEQRAATSAIARQLRLRPEEVPTAVRLDELAAQLSALDQRVTSVSTELANQVTELGHDIDAAGGHHNGNGAGEAVIGELHDGQVRLATEQARYQIAFREDLARLAEQLRRPGAP
ncbi:MAG: hypothetical protein M3487_01760 [Actinomycetota bacterium]|nr:hypothetical protein [Acidimicrobiia bacterium]MDQ3468492.1 hypothetical protein [Actinomycetota bacterium]